MTRWAFARFGVRGFIPAFLSVSLAALGETFVVTEPFPKVAAA